MEIENHNTLALPGRDLALPRQRVRRSGDRRGEHTDMQTVLEAYHQKGAELLAWIQEARTSVQVRTPVLEILSSNGGVPPAVRVEARWQLQSVANYDVDLQGVEASVLNWNQALAAELAAAIRTNNHLPVDPVSGFWSITDPDTWLRLESAFHALDERARRAHPIRRNVERFVGRNARYASTNVTDGDRFSCGAAGSAGGRGGAGAMACTRGAPQGMVSQDVAYYADLLTQVRLFEYGTPVAQNLHLRRYAFPDKSYVDIQAHIPVLTTSAASDWGVLAAGVVGAAGGGWVAGLVGAAVGLVLGVATMAGARPYDAVWQGYTARYYAGPTATSVWGERTYYGWKQSGNIFRAVQIDECYDPTQFPDFAQSPDAFSWHWWRSGNADVRQVPDRHTAALVHAMARMAPAGAGTTTGQFAPATVASQHSPVAAGRGDGLPLLT